MPRKKSIPNLDEIFDAYSFFVIEEWKLVRVGKIRGFVGPTSRHVWKVSRQSYLAWILDYGIFKEQNKCRRKLKRSKK